MTTANTIPVPMNEKARGDRRPFASKDELMNELGFVVREAGTGGPRIMAIMDRLGRSLPQTWPDPDAIFRG